MHYKIAKLVFICSTLFVFTQASQAEELKGGDVHYVLCGESKQGGNVQYSSAGGENWEYLDANGTKGKAKETDHDEWSVYLKDNQNADVQIDMFKKTCKWSKKGSQTRDYKIMQSSKEAHKL